jgi:hypothetical protein
MLPAYAPSLTPCLPGASASRCHGRAGWARPVHLGQTRSRHTASPDPPAHPPMKRPPASFTTANSAKLQSLQLAPGRCTPCCLHRPGYFVNAQAASRFQPNRAPLTTSPSTRLRSSPAAPAAPSGCCPAAPGGGGGGGPMPPGTAAPPKAAAICCAIIAPKPPKPPAAAPPPPPPSPPSPPPAVPPIIASTTKGPRMVAPAAAAGTQLHQPSQGWLAESEQVFASYELD